MNLKEMYAVVYTVCLVMFFLSWVAEEKLKKHKVLLKISHWVNKVSAAVFVIYFIAWLLEK